MATSALEIKTAIYEVCKETFPDAFVSWGFSSDFEKKNIFLEETVWESSEWAAIGAKSKTEVLNQKVWILYAEPAASVFDVETEGVDILNTLETALRNNPTLNGLCIASMLMPDRIDSGPVDNGSHCVIEANVRCTVRI